MYLHIIKERPPHPLLNDVSLFFVLHPPLPPTSSRMEPQRAIHSFPRAGMSRTFFFVAAHRAVQPREADALVFLLAADDNTFWGVTHPLPPSSSWGPRQRQLLRTSACQRRRHPAHGSPAAQGNAQLAGTFTLHFSPFHPPRFPKVWPPHDHHVPISRYCGLFSKGGRGGASTPPCRLTALFALHR